MKRAGRVAKDKHVVQLHRNGASIRDTIVAHPWSADSKSASQAPLHIDLSYEDQAAATQDLHHTGQHKAPRKPK